MISSVLDLLNKYDDFAEFKKQAKRYIKSKKKEFLKTNIEATETLTLLPYFIDFAVFPSNLIRPKLEKAAKNKIMVTRWFIPLQEIERELRHINRSFKAPVDNPINPFILRGVVCHILMNINKDFIDVFGGSKKKAYLKYLTKLHMDRRKYADNEHPKTNKTKIDKELHDFIDTIQEQGDLKKIKKNLSKTSAGETVYLLVIPALTEYYNYVSSIVNEDDFYLQIFDFVRLITPDRHLMSEQDFKNRTVGWERKSYRNYKLTTIKHFFKKK